MIFQPFDWSATTLTLMPLATAADTYAYDARGRLNGACYIASGDAVRTEYLLDSADNQTTYRNFPVIIIIPAGSSIYSGDGALSACHVWIGVETGLQPLAGQPTAEARF